MSWVVAIRTINGLGCLFALCLLLVSAIRQWHGWNLKTQQHWWALAGWTGLGFEGMIESFFIHITPGPRTVLTSLVVAWTIRAILINDDLKAKAALSRKDPEE